MLAQPPLTNAGLMMLLAYATLRAFDMRRFGFATFVSVLIGLWIGMLLTFDVCGGLSRFEIVRSYARLTLLVVAGRHTGCGGFELAAAILAVLATAIRACVLSFGLFVCAIRNCCIHAFN